MKESAYRSLYNFLFNKASLREKALQASEERLQTLINSSPDIICFKDAEGRWMQANDSILDLYGLKGVDYKGKSEFELSDFTAPIYRDAFRNCQGSDDLAWDSGTTSRTIEKIPDIHGKIHVFDVVKVPLFFPDRSRKGLVVFGRDINDFKQTESALRESEEKYRQIADNTSDVIWMMNDKMQYIYVSPSIFKQRGYTPEEFLNLKLSNIYPPDSLNKIKDLYSSSLALALERKLPKDFSLTLELEHYCKDGSLRASEVHTNPVFDQDGKILGAHGVSRDITDRKQAEIILRETEERFKLAFRTSPDSININELETGLYIEVNEGFCSLTGYTREEVIGKTSLEINLWADSADRGRLVEILKKDEKVQNFEAAFRFKDGTVHTGLMSASIIHLNEVPNIISITRDIEEMKQAERELFRAKEAAEEASRLKTAFLNNISHEVRTPMNAIIGFTELLQSDDVTGSEKDRYFGIINSNSKQLLSIIDDVLEISRMDSGRIPFNPDAFLLPELIEDIHFSMKEMVVSKGIQFRYSIDNKGGSEQVIADREKIKQVITGLIGNASKFTQTGTISFGCTITEKEIEFYVRDTGIGIPLEEQDKIFDRFYQINHEALTGLRGTGLGLSIAKGLAEVMGGNIRVESSPGKGSVFFLNIPYQEPGSAAVTVEHRKSFSIEDLIILIAEDEDYNYELLHILLSKKAKNIIRAKNGAEVLTILERLKPDLILMDLKMPVMNGYEATRKAKAMYPDILIIALTAYTQSEEESRAMEAGCSGFISKPVRKDELMESISRSVRS